MAQVIIAMNEKGGIGYKNHLPWKCKEELALFRQKTMGKTIIVGRNTAANLPNLFGRTIVCVTRATHPNLLNTSEWNNKVVLAGSDWLDTVSVNSEDVMIAGGGELYTTVFEKPSLVKKVHLSVIKGDHECDVYFRLELLKNFVIVEKTEFDEFTHFVLERTDCGEQQYLDLLRKIMETGVKRLGRNGETISIFKNDMTFDLRKGFPLLTTKKMFLRGVLEEFLFFIRGDTDSSKLSEKNVRIWEGNTSEEFISSRGLPYSKGVMGPMYGYQWRFFNAPYELDNLGRPLDTQGGFDQLADVVKLIKDDPYSRRILMTSYNPSQSKMGVLHPCHSITIQFFVEDDFLDMFCYNRSQDAFLGVPFNIASSSLLQMTIAKLTSKIPRFFYMTMGDTHIYSSHVEQAKTQIARIPYSFPKLKLPDIQTLEDVGRLSAKDFVLSEYTCHPQIEAVMVA